MQTLLPLNHKPKARRRRKPKKRVDLKRWQKAIEHLEKHLSNLKITDNEKGNK